MTDETKDDSNIVEITIIEKAKKAAPQFSIIKIDDEEVFKIKKGSTLAQSLSRGLGYVDNSYRVSQMDNEYPVHYIESHIEQLKETLQSLGHHPTRDPLKGFFSVIDERRAIYKAACDERTKDGVLVFTDIPFLFEKGAEIIVGRGDEAVGGIVTGTVIRRTMFGSYAQINFKTIVNTSGKAQKITTAATVPMFSGLLKIVTLDVRPATDAEKAPLAARGELFRKFSGGAVHAAYTGTINQPTWGGERMFRADGRIMIDPRAMRNAEPNLFSNFQGRNDDDDDDYGYDDDNENSSRHVDANVPDSELWMTAPYLLGFSFASKQWGKLRVLGISDIVWRSDAFDKVVLPAEDKQVVRALVEHSQGSFTDIIDGKGGGTIFLLHGEPGQGKTLLAETTAEMLKRPLYTISVGELGISPDELEERLRNVLDLASTWDAVLLLDEADIFLEERNENDIVRNAMVGVFLRLLEYFSGNLFLTTNRVKNIDRAFFSRISVALQFGTASEQKLAAIWTNLLASANVSGLDAAKLAKDHAHLNGRQIKNSIRLAQTLARSQGVDLTIEHVERTIDLGTRFTLEFDNRARDRAAL